MPVRPTGVVLVTRDTGYALQITDRLRYAGRDGYGLDRWVIDLDQHEWLAVLRGERTVHVALLPPRATVEIACR